MEQAVLSTEYTVGLNREEYIYSQALTARALRGKHLLGSRVFSAVMMLLCVLAVLFDRVLGGACDTSLLVLVLLMIAAEVWVFAATPRQIRRKNGIIYDQTRFKGHTFDGVITVDNDGIVKKTGKEQTAIPFSRCFAFIEDTEMMLFCVNGGKCIVIPKRFLTDEDAELTRKAALATMAPARCYLLGKVNAELTARLPLPETDAFLPEEPLLQIEVQYTAREIRSRLMDSAMRAYAQKLPQKAMVAVLVTVLAYFWFDIATLPTFLLCSVLLFLFSWFGALLRANHVATVMSGAENSATNFVFTDTAVLIKETSSEALTVPWDCITRAVSAPDEVEFYVHGEKAFVIPKRCVEDMAQLSRVVDAHLSAE